MVGNRVAGGLSGSPIGIAFVALGPDAVGFNEVLNDKVHGTGGPNSSYGFYIQSGNNLVERSEFGKGQSRAKAQCS